MNAECVDAVGVVVGTKALSAMLVSGQQTESSIGDQSTTALRLRAVASHKRDQYALAELLYREILGRYPNDLQASRGLAVLALQTHRFDWALQLLSEVYREDQSDAIRDCLGTALRGLNRPDHTLEWSQNTHARASNDASARGAGVSDSPHRQPAPPSRGTSALHGMDAADSQTLHDAALGGFSRFEGSSPSTNLDSVAKQAKLAMHAAPGNQLEELSSGARAIARDEPVLAENCSALDDDECAQAAAEGALAASARALAATESAQYIFAAATATGADMSTHAPAA